ncbi:MAG: host attachment protein, partial [Gammaproteobacteria bacterium]|nr:host attachment protein [Gammaproteobacteria bacterium]
NAGDEDVLSLAARTQADHENPRTRDQGADRPGRYPSGGGARSAVGNSDWHKLEKDRSARDLADRLKAWAEDGLYEQLVIIADPRTLGALRRHLGAEVRGRLLGEI